MKISYGEVAKIPVMVNHEKRFFMLGDKEYRFRENHQLFTVFENMATKILKGKIESVTDDTFCCNGVWS